MSSLAVKLPLWRPLWQGLSDRGLLLFALALAVPTLLLPLGTLVEHAFFDDSGRWVGFARFLGYLADPALQRSLRNSLWVSTVSTLISVTLAFLAAYSVSRTLLPGRGLLRLVLFLPLMAPSLMPGLALVYWFGEQGLAKGLLFGAELYGPVGIVIGSVFWTLPLAFLILSTAFANADGRLFEAARVLGASPFRVFRTVTLPSVRYGLIGSAVVVFTQVFTDFGVPKVIGGQYNVLPTDIYKQVIGQHNFGMGSAISLVLILPALLSFAVDRWSASKQSAALGARATRYTPPPDRLRDGLAGVYALLLSAAVLAVMGMAVYASLVSYWPYNLTLTLDNYRFESVPGTGWRAFRNSLELAFHTACFGTVLVFLFAYFTEKGRKGVVLRNAFRLFAMLPLAIPGLVLGLGYVFYFNAPGNPLNVLYGGMSLLVICTVVHFYSVVHMTAATAINQLDREFEAANAMLGAPAWRLLRKVTLPVCLPAILDIWFYLFVNGIRTVSAVIFLYATDTTLASVASLNLDDSGETAEACAMAVLIVLACLLVRLLHWLVSRFLLARLQHWRQS